MDKLFIGTLIVVFTSVIGYIFSLKYKRKRVFFSDLLSFHERYLSELNYTKRPIYEIIDTINPKNDLYECLQEWLKIENKNEISIDVKYLKQTDIDFFKEYLLSLGKGNSYTQKEVYEAKTDTIKKFYNESKENEKKYTNLYVKLGILIGLTLIILIV